MTERILFVATEVHPYLKVGGLADVAAGLPKALAQLGHEARVLVPATAAALKALRGKGAEALPTTWPGMARGSRILEAPLAGRRARVWLLDTPGFRRRTGTPYQDAKGADYPDDALRYDELARAAAALAAGNAGLDWRPTVVHCNEWHTGLVPVRMLLQRVPTACVFTIHNLGYQGLFRAADFAALKLPAWLWHPQALEFHGRMNFMKAGLVFSDKLNAVSPGYAREILTRESGAGLEDLLRQRAADLGGILNGIDMDAWDPAHDSALAAKFDAAHPAGKAANRAALLGEFGLAAGDRMLIGLVARLVPQKGIDLFLEALPALLRLPVSCVVLGSGDAALQAALGAAAKRHSDRLAVRLGYDEALARRIYAGCDAFLMPSRFEPCGLSQLYAMRYGTLPIVHRTGGLADTVHDASAPRADGFVFGKPSAAALTEGVQRALAQSRRPAWARMQRRAMTRDFSWERSAEAYLKLYGLAQSSRR
jgi:starch synthase